MTEERVNTVTAKLRQLVLATADNAADASLADQQFSAARDAGKGAVEPGKSILMTEKLR